MKQMGRGLSKLTGVTKTLQLLATTRNEAADAVLVAGLRSSDRRTQYDVLRAILERSSSSARQAVVKKWHELLDHLKMIVAEAPGRFPETLQSVIGAEDLELVSNACDAVQWLRCYDLIPTLVETAEDRSRPHGEVVAQSLLDICDRLRDEMDQPNASPALRSDANRALAKLAISAESFGKHRRTEIIESLLLVAENHSQPLRRILRNPQHPAHSAVLETMANSPRTGVIRLLCEFLNDAHAPLSVIRVVGRRCDLSFLRTVFRQIHTDVSQDMRHNLRQLDRLQWAKEDLGRVFSLVDIEQSGAMRMLQRSGLSRETTFPLLVQFLQDGSAGGRQAAVQALKEYRGDEANSLLLRAVDDLDPGVQAEALLQLRDRRIPGAVSRLLHFVESPHLVVREAAKACLSEFNLNRYLHTFESMDVEARVNTGRLVMTIDNQAAAELLDEIQSHDRVRKLRGLKAAAAMGAVPAVEDAVVSALAHEDHFIRVEAARALGTSDSVASRTALHNAIGDSSVVVQQTAQEALNNLISAAPAPQADGPAFADLAFDIPPMNPNSETL